jgi:hypothetical protein
MLSAGTCNQGLIKVLLWTTMSALTVAISLLAYLLLTILSCFGNLDSVHKGWFVGIQLIRIVH